MNIIDINYKKLRERIADYILMNNSELYSCIDLYVPYDKPIILMNNETLKLLNERNKKYIKDTNKLIPTIEGCYIAIANWLPFGEVQLK